MVAVLYHEGRANPDIGVLRNGRKNRSTERLIGDGMWVRPRLNGIHTTSKDDEVGLRLSNGGASAAAKKKGGKRTEHPIRIDRGVERIIILMHCDHLT